MFIRFTARAFRKLLSIYVFSYFLFGFEGRIWDLTVSVTDYCLSFYFVCKPLFETNIPSNNQCQPNDTMLFNEDCEDNKIIFLDRLNKY